MRILNWNIAVNIDNTENVINFIKNDNFDIVALQEVMRGSESSVFCKYNNANAIKYETGFQYSFFGPLWIANHTLKNGELIHNFGGFTEQGNEILANYPLLQASNSFFYKDYSIYCDRTNFETEDHPRALIDAIFNINGKKLQVICVHGIWNKDKLGDQRTIDEVNFILSKVRFDIPSIIVGDFNLLPTSNSIKILDEKVINLVKEYGIKSTRPNLDNSASMVCDYIFVNDRIKINDFKVVDSLVSDHLPMILDFDI